MPISKYTIGVKGDMCQCGRKKSVIHCPYCGSTSTRTYANPRYHKHMNCEIKEVDKLRHCNACGENFTNDERDACDATPIGAADAARKLQMLAEAEASPTLTSNEFEAARTAKRLLDELKQVGPSNPDEARALAVLEKHATVEPDEQYRAYVATLYMIRGEYNAECLTYKERGETHPDTLTEYVNKLLIQHNIERVPNPKGDDADEDWIRGLYQ